MLGLVNQLRDHKFAGAIHGDEQVKLFFSGLQLSNVDMKVANWAALKTLLLWLVPIGIRQAGGAVPL